jgi:cell division protein FtsB
MYIANKPSKFTKRTAINAVILLMLMYFIFHAIYGSRGIVAYFRLQSELEDSHQKLATLRAERLEIENKTKLLRPGSLDKDMLDETTRDVLGVSSSEEEIYKAPEKEIKNDTDKN